MAKFTRNPWPTKVVWLQDDVIHRRFYWLSVPEGVELKEKQKITATVKDRTITLEGDVPPHLTLRLSDRLLDLDRPLTVLVNGKKAFHGKPKRRAADILASLEERADATSAATSTVTWK